MWEDGRAPLEGLPWRKRVRQERAGEVGGEKEGEGLEGSERAESLAWAIVGGGSSEEGWEGGRLIDEHRGETLRSGRGAREWRENRKEERGGRGEGEARQRSTEMSTRGRGNAARLTSSELPHISSCGGGGTFRKHMPPLRREVRGGSAVGVDSTAGQDWLG